MRILSVAAFVLMITGILWQYRASALMARSVAGMAVQVLAVALMIWARITFGRRSFHATANPTRGGLVQHGPYAWVRHPIYAAVLYFVWAGALQHRVAAGFAGAGIVTIGGVARMLCEEHLLRARYAEYDGYMQRVRRVVPFIL